jgi:hypothetical protein
MKMPNAFDSLVRGRGTHQMAKNKLNLSLEQVFNLCTMSFIESH